MKSDILKKYPFSLFDIDGSWEMWQSIYSPYIDLIESNLHHLKNTNLSLFRNYDFSSNKSHFQRIADLVITEIEEETTNPIFQSSPTNFDKSNNKFEEQYNAEVEKEDRNLKITFIFTNRKRQALKIMQLLKLTSEVKKFASLMHQKVLKQYSNIIPQIIFISLFGYDDSVGEYLKNNLHGNFNGNSSIIIVPPIENKLWNNFFVTNPIEGKNDFTKHKSGINFKDYNTLRNNGGANQFQVKKMESYYKNLIENKKISEYNAHELNIWANILNIDKSSTLLDVQNSKEKINKLMMN